MPSLPKQPYVYVCNECGSTDVCTDATAYWDVAAQDWVLAGVMDQEWCAACDGEAKLITRPATIQDY